MMAGWRFDDVITREHILRMVFRQRELNFPPGAEHLYSNSGYSLLAEVARVAGKLFREVAEERIFRPLGMSRTRVHDDLEEIARTRLLLRAARRRRVAQQRALLLQRRRHQPLHHGRGPARWLRNFEIGEVGGKAAIESLTTRGVLSSGKTIDYALGLANGIYRGAPAISHGGSDAGFRSMVIWLPEHRLGVAVLANLSSFDAGGAAQSVIDVVIGDRLAPAPAETGGQASAAARPPIELPAAVLDEYVGAYQLDMGALVTIERRDTGLVASTAIGETSALVPLSETELLMQAIGALLTFERAPGKPAPGFKVKWEVSPSPASGSSRCPPPAHRSPRRLLERRADDRLSAAARRRPPDRAARSTPRHRALRARARHPRRRRLVVHPRGDHARRRRKSRRASLDRQPRSQRPLRAPLIPWRPLSGHGSWPCCTSVWRSSSPLTPSSTSATCAPRSVGPVSSGWRRSPDRCSTGCSASTASAAALSVSSIPRWWCASRPASTSPAPPAVRASWSEPLVELAARATGNALLSGNRVTPLDGGDIAYPAMLDAIAAGEHSILFTTYIFDHDRAGSSSSTRWRRRRRAGSRCAC